MICTEDQSTKWLITVIRTTLSNLFKFLSLFFQAHFRSRSRTRGLKRRRDPSSMDTSTTRKSSQTRSRSQSRTRDESGLRDPEVSPLNHLLWTISNYNCDSRKYVYMYSLFVAHRTTQLCCQTL